MKKKLGIVILVMIGTLLPASYGLNYTVFDVMLTGDQEVGSPGDPDGIAWGTLSIDGEANEIAWDFEANNIFVPLVGFHIHEAPAGANGPVVFNFASLWMGSAVDPVASEILDNPSHYYLNMHTQEFPAGAVRGQLADADAVPDSSSAAVGALAIASLLIAGRRLRKAA